MQAYQFRVQACSLTFVQEQCDVMHCGPTKLKQSELGSQVCSTLSCHTGDAGEKALKAAGDSAKDAAGKEDELSPRHGDSAGKRLAKRGGRPAKQVWLLSQYVNSLLHIPDMVC